MAKIELNSGSLLAHGKMGNLVLRRGPTGISIYPLPDFSRRKSTAKQKAGRERFKRCAPVAHALLNDPRQRIKCLRLAERRHWQLWNAAMSLASQSVH